MLTWGRGKPRRRCDEGKLPKWLLEEVIHRLEALDGPSPKRFQRDARSKDPGGDLVLKCGEDSFFTNEFPIYCFWGSLTSPKRVP